MTKEWYTAQDLEGLPGVPGTARGINKAADREGWKAQKRSKGKGREFHLNSLPQETQAAILVGGDTHPDTSSVDLHLKLTRLLHLNLTRLSGQIMT